MRIRFGSQVGAAGACGAGLLLATMAAAQPVNDDCDGAIAILPGQTITDTTTLSHPTEDVTSCTIRDIRAMWYTFTPEEDITASFNVCTSSFDTSLAVFDGCGGNELACDDDACGFGGQSSLSMEVAAGQTYYIRVSGFNGGTGMFSLQTTLIDGAPGADVVYTDIQSISHYGPVGQIHAYSLGSWTCNIGTENLRWGNSWDGSPGLAMNAYRLHDGRLTQIGQSWVKHACCAAAGSGCGIPCNGSGGSVLGAGCRDVYGSGYNGGQSRLGARSALNAYTGDFVPAAGGTGDAIFKRLQVHQNDLTQTGALYFVEGVYIASDDAPAGNAMNNASYKRVSVAPGSFDLNLEGGIFQYVPALYAWRDHGNGVDQIDDTVTLANLDIAGEGRFMAGGKVTDNGNGTWTYDYAVFNLNSDASAGSFSVPVPLNTTVTNIGFHDVDYHSGEPYSGADWQGNKVGGEVIWQTEDFATNPNANAIRWGTMYNFWFTADLPPRTGTVSVGTFKPGVAPSADGELPVPGSACLCEYDGTEGVDVQDLLVYLAGYFTDDAAAELTGDGTVDFFDLLAFLDCWFPATLGTCE